MFQIPKIEKSNFYIDLAMKSMQEYAIKERERINERFAKNKNPAQREKGSDEINLNKRKDLELQKIRHLNDKVSSHLKKIISGFPKFKKVDDVYIKLMNTSDVSLKDTQDALARLLWISNTVDEMTQNNEVKIKRARTPETVGFIMKKYLGRVNSYFRKNKSFFVKLDESRRFLNKLPTFLDIFTVSIAGFPNVGKSTLMNEISNSNVEIQNYPFTTKGLMFGYLKKANNNIVQLIDTPGLLGRDKLNDIEKRAELIVSHYSNLIVFVIDLTSNCGFSVKKQIKLLKETKNYNKPIIIYLSKIDIYDEEAEEEKERVSIILKKYKVLDNYDKVKEYILNEEVKIKNQKFNIKNVKIIK